MKKSLVALATLAVAGMASAQSSVTLFGVVDAGISYYDAKANSGAKQSSWQQTNSGYNSSRIGFRGTEDLGGGLAAGFWLEAGLGNDAGTAGGGSLAAPSSQLFNRRSTVSLSGPFGELRVGRDYTATFWNDTTFDPFGTNGVGTNIINTAHSAILTGAGVAADPTTVRSNNMVAYFLPANLGGFYGQAQYAFHENVNNAGTLSNVYDSKANQYVGGRFGYANGPIDVALAYGQATVVDVTAANEVKAKTFNLGASYDLGVVKLFGELSQVKNEFSYAPALLAGDRNVPLNGALIGVTAPIGAGVIRASYSTVKAKVDNAPDPKADKYSIGYVHNLSKRTALYATYAHIKNKDGANFTTGGTYSFSPTKAANGYDFGIRHAF